MMLRLLALLCLSCASALPANHPCNTTENPETIAFLADCAKRVDAECSADPAVPAVPCAIEAECEAAWARRCEQ
jgi:hypothetical protein